MTVWLSMEYKVAGYFPTAFFFNFNFYCYSITVVCLFSPSLHPTPPEPTSLPHLHPPPWFCPCVLYSISCNPLSSLSPPHSPLTIVRLFLTSMSLVIFCLPESGVAGMKYDVNLFFIILYMMHQPSTPAAYRTFPGPRCSEMSLQCVQVQGVKGPVTLLPLACARPL